MNIVEYWLGTALVTASVPASLWFGFGQLRTSRAVKDLPTSKIRSAAQGYVELEGVGVRMADKTECPLTYTTCLWWHYKVEEYKRSGKNKRWCKIEEEKSEAPFWVDDGTGRCVVDPARAQIFPVHERQWYGRSPADAQRPRNKILFFRKYRYTERFLYEGGPLYVLGDFRTTTTDHAAALESAVRARLDAWRKDPAMMKRLDVNRDGHVDQREWDAARRMARLQVEREGVAVPEPAHTIGKLTENSYIVSGKPQKEVMHALHKQARGWMLWFIVALPLSAYLILSPFGLFK